jgi:hypothetical protein
VSDSLTVRVVQHLGHPLVELRTAFEGKPVVMLLSPQQARVMAATLNSAAEQAERRERV